MSANDRTVHGVTGDGGEIVRYGRSGKWWIEYADGRHGRSVSIRGAVLAATNGARFYGKPGGRTFDRLCREEGR